jgi:hypothetical protein
MVLKRKSPPRMLPGSLAYIRRQLHGYSLVSCPISNLAFAVGQLAVFKVRAKRPYLVHTGRSAAAEEKQPTGHGPEGCDENGPGAALLVGYVSI